MDYLKFRSLTPPEQEQILSRLQSNSLELGLLKQTLLEENKPNLVLVGKDLEMEILKTALIQAGIEKVFERIEEAASNVQK